MIWVVKQSVILQIPEEVEFQCNAAFALLSSSRRLPSVVLPDMLSDPPYLPSHSQEFLFHSACCYHWIDDVINIILLLYINSDSDFHITLCSASYGYKTIFIIKSWFFLPPPSDSGGTAQYLCGSLVNITSEQQCNVFAFAFLKEWEWTYVLSLEPG